MKLFDEYKKELNEGEKDREKSMAMFLKGMLDSNILEIKEKGKKISLVLDVEDPEFKLVRTAIEKRYKRAIKSAGMMESEVTTPLFVEYKASKNTSIDYLNEEENQLVDEYVNIFDTEHDGTMDEGFFGKILGGVTGFLVGPTLGKVIAKALGIEKGVLFDMFTSRLVSTALGSAIGKYMTENKGKIK